MHKGNLFFWALAISFIGLSGCKYFSKSKQGEVVAECYGQYLYKSKLEGLITPGTSVNDSIAITKQFIDNWIRQQIMLNQAENNLTEEQKDFSEQLESYRNSLIIYAYESELIYQKLDTVITDEQMEEFYNQNLENFQLRENIVKVNYLKIPIVSAKGDLLKKAARLIKSRQSDDKEELNELCQNSMLSCKIDEDEWIRFNDLLHDIPIQTDDQEHFLKNTSYYEVSDSLFTYLVYFTDYKTKEGVSPLSFELRNLRNLIINRRKIELMNKMQQEIFQEALKKKEFTIY